MIYLAKIKGEKKCKIGYSNNPNNRLGSLQTSSPDSIYLLTVMDGDIPMEKELHKKFAPFKIKGEWFTYSTEIKEYFGVDERYAIFEPMVKFLKTAPVMSRRVFAYLMENNIESSFIYDKKMRVAIANNIGCAERTLDKPIIFEFLIDNKLVLKNSNDKFTVNPNFVQRIYHFDIEEELALRRDLASMGLNMNLKPLIN